MYCILYFNLLPFANNNEKNTKKIKLTFIIGDKLEKGTCLVKIKIIIKNKELNIVCFLIFTVLVSLVYYQLLLLFAPRYFLNKIRLLYYGQILGVILYLNILR